MRLFRKIVMPIVWAAIFATIAVSLAVMAFGSDPKAPESGLKPTGKIPAANTGVSRGTVENALVLHGTIAVDPPVEAKAIHDGTINHFFFPVGAKVKVGDPLFQVKSEETDPGSVDSEDAPKPKIRYYTAYAAKGGKISGFAKEIGDEVTKGDIVGTIAQSTFRAKGSISPIDQYRLLHKPGSATVTISDGPAPFKCTDLTIGDTVSTDTTSGSEGTGQSGVDIQGDPSQGDGSGQGSGGAQVSCRVPDDVRVFDGLEMTLSIDAGRAEDVLVVPVTAVRGLIDKGSVWVLAGGKPVERKVTLGLSDGQVVEVKKGLKEGENILEFVPGGTQNGNAEEGFSGVGG